MTDTSMTVTVRTGEIDAQKGTIQGLIHNSALFDATPGTLQAGTYTLSGGEGMVVESKLRVRTAIKLKLLLMKLQLVLG